MGALLTRDGSLRLMTWNIHGTFSVNRRFDLKRVVELIKRIDPDIVALQEVDSRGLGEGCEDPFEVLREAVGDHGIGAKSIVTADGGYGQTLISRYPLRNPEIRDISFGEFEPRRAIRAMAETPLGNVCVIATHLGLSIRERREQTRTLLQMIGQASPFVVLGDFNDWFWPNSVRSVLAGVLPGRSRHRTFPSWCPVLRLDRIYCRPVDSLLRTWTDPQGRIVSDHLPVIAELRLRRSCRAIPLEKAAGSR